MRVLHSAGYRYGSTRIAVVDWSRRTRAAESDPSSSRTLRVHNGTGVRRLWARPGPTGNWGDKQDRVAFARDLLELMTEVIAEHFQVKTLKLITGLQLPDLPQPVTPQPPMTAA